ncbi:MAG: hypothetical protein RLZZ139_2624 [Cyanobacteriota bacterium]|jgi:hypothetical protein
MNLLLVAKQGNHGGIAPTPKFKGYRRYCAVRSAIFPKLVSDAFIYRDDINSMIIWFFMRF